MLQEPGDPGDGCRSCPPLAPVCLTEMRKGKVSEQMRKIWVPTIYTSVAQLGAARTSCWGWED
jgi:hypothetical protein